jgi:DNA-binding NtrC family response regulator
MVERAGADRHAACIAADVTDSVAIRPGLQPRVWIVEDEPAAGALAAELCEAWGAEASVFRAPLPYLAALRETLPPMAVVLDWRLEHELSAALFLATRHRYPRLPVIYWTGSAASALPSMIVDDALTTLVDKADGARPFERALEWARDVFNASRRV